MKRKKAAGVETETAPRRPSFAPPLAVVVRVHGARATPQTFRLTGGTCRVGAGKDADIVVDHPAVSRAHVELGLVPEGIALRDLDSRNGTFYLGQRVRSITLAPGSRIQLGVVEVSLEPDEAALGDAEPWPDSVYRGMIGSSHAMRSLFGALARLEGSLVSVLVTGESGVGKELVARAIHEGSAVSAGPLVTVNCGALPPELVASELFGHRKGAFTGATDNRKGAFESAHGGTLFLDEIGELPLDVQPMLLRALESGEVRAVGSDRAAMVRVRVVAATNRDLPSEVRAGRFREDLFYRLAVVSLAVPPLRERLEDLEELANRFATAMGLDPLSPQIVARLRVHRWQGNVRELRNAVQAYAAIGRLPTSPEAEPATLLDAFTDPTRPYADLKDALLDTFTRAYLVRLMEHTNGNQSAAARLSGIDRSWLWRLLVKYGLTKG